MGETPRNGGRPSLCEDRVRDCVKVYTDYEGSPFMRRTIGLAALVSLLSFSLLADDKKKDPDEIGNRDVGKGVNFYSIEKEIALGKQLAQEVERQAKLIDDPVISEYVNRVGQNL